MYKTTILEAPFVKIHPSSGSQFQIFMGRLLSLIPKLRIPGSQLKRDLLTRDAEIKKRWAADPLQKPADIFAGTAGSFLRVADAFDTWLKDKQVNFSFFMAIGDSDYACEPQACIDFYEQSATPANLKQLRVYKGAYHTLKYDPRAPEFFQDVLDWVKKFL